MGFVEDVAAQAAAATTLGLGVGVFVNFRPDTPHTCIAVVETGGVGPQHHFGGGRSWRHPAAQITSRSTSSQTARANADAVYLALDGHHNAALPAATSGSQFFRIVAVQEPFLLMRDDRARPVFAFNIDATFS